MANNEAQFRVELVRSFNRQGAHALSINDRFIIGHPDVYACMRPFGGVWLELKFVKYCNPQAKYPLRLSLAQRAFLLAEQKAGGFAGWVLCARIEQPRMWCVLAGMNPNRDFASNPEHMVEVRRGGEKLEWTPELILMKMLGEAK